MVDVVDKIKDVLGIFDDAQDFIERIKKESGQTKALFKKFSSLTSDQAALIRKVESSGKDVGKVKEIMDQLDIDRPLLIGKNLLRRLQDSRNILSKLAGKVRNVPASARSEVKSALDKASRQLDQGIKQHISTIRVFSDIQQNRKRFFQGIVKNLALTGGAVAAGVVLGGAASAAVRAITHSPLGTFSRETVQTASFFEEGLNELERNLMRGRSAIGSVGN